MSSHVECRCVEQLLEVVRRILRGCGLLVVPTRLLSVPVPGWVSGESAIAGAASIPVEPLELSFPNVAVPGLPEEPIVRL